MQNPIAPSWPCRHEWMFRQIIQRRSPILIKMHYRRFGRVILPLRPPRIVERNRRSGRLHAMIDLRRRGHESVARQTRHRAQHGTSELEDVRITNDAWVFSRCFRRCHEHPHGKAAGGNVDILGGDYHWHHNSNSPLEMELREKAAQLPLLPGVYLYKDQYGEVIYVGKAKNLRARVRSYFNDDRLADVKTGTLIADARDVEYILVDNNKEALALENNLIKQWKPRFNILLRDDKTFPYIKLTKEKYPRVYVTRRLIKDGSTYYGPYFPGNLAHRLVHFIHRHFKIPSCKVDFTRSHTHPCLEYHIHRCLGPCVGRFNHRRSLRRRGSRREAVPGRAS